MRAKATIRSAAGGVALALALGMIFSAGALATSPAPAWEVSSVAQPANFSSEDNPKCEEHKICDRYVVTLTNVGGTAIGGTPAVIADKVPDGLRLVGLNGDNLESGSAGFECSIPTATCIYGGTVQPGGTLVLSVEVEIEEPFQAKVVTNVITATGGGAAPVTTSEPLTLPNTVDGRPSGFGFAALNFAAHNVSGLLDTRADDHPSSVTTTVNLNTLVGLQPNGRTYRLASVEAPRDLVVYLPLGFSGDPTTAERCTQTQLLGNGRSTETECPSTSRIGTIVLFEEEAVLGSVTPEGGATTAVYNMVPEAGYPAEFAFKVLGRAVPIYASLVHAGLGYALRVGTPGIPNLLNVEGLAVTFYGDPHIADGDPHSSQTFLTNPGNCRAGPLTMKVEADSWAAPGQWISGESTAYPGMTGCNLLQFEPTLDMLPEVTQAEEPSGYEINIKVPQSPKQFPLLATPQLEDVTMTLPEGLAISPGGGNGLVACEAAGPHGIDIPSGERHPNEAGEGEAIGPDGMSHLTPGHCPQSSQIGTVKIATPVLETSLTGHLYVAQPQCGGQGQPICTTADAANGDLFGLYLEAAGSGVVVKLAGRVSVNPATGQLTARFTENPQMPVSEISLNIEGGGRAPLSNPRQCGMATASGDLTPWSSPVTPDAFVSSPFKVDWDGNGGVCPAVLPFAPTLTAGSTTGGADRFTSFSLTIGRTDHQQDPARLQVKTPLGLLGMLSNVPLCGEPQAQQGLCGEASRIGTVSVEAGAGSQPLGVKGRVYLTGPYKGAPFGFSIVVPAIAGPFNLGNVVVRSRIDVDPNTAVITVTSDPLPQILDGVPLRIQTLNVAIDREGFIFNPTSCTAKQIAATIEAAQGAAANLSTPFAVEGCRGLPFHPKFSVATAGKASKARGASLSVKVASKGGPQPGGGEANIKSVKVDLPKQLPSRLTTLQKACTAAVFEANPANCPALSDVGSATAVTPVLSHPLVGPAYLVSHGGAGFPDLEIILQGEGIVLILDGSTNIKKGITSSAFSTVPDAPISSFELRLPAGRYSVLGTNLPARAKYSFCGQKLTMPTTITGQNGAVIKQSTKISVTGCPKSRPKKKAETHAGRGRHGTLR